MGPEPCRRSALPLIGVFAFLLVLGATLMLSAEDVSAKTLLVPDDYATIQQAVDNATAGDEVRIEVKKGTPSANQKPPAAELRVMSTADGKQSAKYKLDCEPVFDGMAAAYGRLYIPLKNGKIVCMGR